MSITSKQNASSAIPEKLTKLQVEEDMKLLKEALKHNHPGVFEFQTRESFQKDFDRFHDLVKTEMPTMNLFDLLNQALVKIDCSHTRIYPPPEFIDQIGKETGLFPLVVTFINGDVFIRRNCSNDSNLVEGTRIIEIDGIGIEDIVKCLMEKISSDGGCKAYRYKLLENSFFYYYALHIDQPRKFLMSYILPNETEIKKTELKALDSEDIRMYDYLRYKKYHKNDFLPFTFQIHENKEKPKYGILGIKSFDRKFIKKTGVRYDKFLSNAFSELKKNNVQNLIIDLRDNLGGHIEQGALLLTYLARQKLQYLNNMYSITENLKFHKHYSISFWQRAVLYLRSRRENNRYVIKQSVMKKIIKPSKDHFTGKVYCIIDNGNVSACGMVISILQNINRGITIGNITGDKSVSNSGYVSTITLPNSRLMVDMPLIKMDFMYSRDNRKIKNTDSHLGISQNLEDLIKNKDTIKDYTIDLIT